MRADGGIGIRACLRCMWEQSLGGSSPLSPTLRLSPMNRSLLGVNKASQSIIPSLSKSYYFWVISSVG